jgi:hypothetical protein
VLGNGSSRQQRCQLLLLLLSVLGLAYVQARSNEERNARSSSANDNACYGGWGKLRRAGAWVGEEVCFVLILLDACRDV